MTDKSTERLKKSILTLQDLIVELSCALTDEGPSWSNDGLRNLRVRSANAIPPDMRPDWLNEYADPALLQSSRQSR